MVAPRLLNTTQLPLTFKSVVYTVSSEYAVIFCSPIITLLFIQVLSNSFPTPPLVNDNEPS